MRSKLLAWGLLVVVAGAAFSWAQTTPTSPAPSQASTNAGAATAPATPPARFGRGNRGAARGPAPQQFPTQIQDTNTGQWYTPQRHAEYAFGADLSSLRQTELQGRIQYKDNGATKPAMQIFADHGFNWVRLRVCTPPPRHPQQTPHPRAKAQDAQNLGV